jgi:xanthine dehydrogenase accessory factor
MTWLSFARNRLRQGEDVVVVTVAAVDGSVPREAGTKMAISRGGQGGSIGGGVLEFEATRKARALLAEPDGGRRRCERFALGPALGQCCGGAAVVLLERVADAGALDPWERAEQGAAGGFVATPLSPDGDRAVCVDAAGLAAWIGREVEVPPPGGCVIAVDSRGRQVLLERPARDRTQVWLFGAGHVGQAIVHALTPLPFHVTWIDCRAGYLPDAASCGVTPLHAETPPDIVDKAPSGAVVLVMTHSHALDLDVCTRALQRDDLGWVGLIGSASKRASFLRRFREQGLTEAEIGRLVCPIGLPAIKGKEPAVIAASVTAQLLAAREQIQLAAHRSEWNEQAEVSR